MEGDRLTLLNKSLSALLSATLTPKRVRKTFMTGVCPKHLNLTKYHYNKIRLNITILGLGM